jgi:hypothetical protein
VRAYGGEGAALGSPSESRKEGASMELRRIVTLIGAAELRSETP